MSENQSSTDLYRLILEHRSQEFNNKMPINTNEMEAIKTSFSEAFVSGKAKWNLEKNNETGELIGILTTEIKDKEGKPVVNTNEITDTDEIALLTGIWAETNPDKK